MTSADRLDLWKNVLRVVYGGIPDKPESDSDQLLAIADWLDRIDDATDIALEGRHVIDRSGSLQESLRRIAATIAPDPPFVASGTVEECEAEMRRLTNGERGCANPEEHAR